jgi:hypothetical protein
MEIARKTGGYIEQMSKFERALVEYLNNYYQEHKHYPENLDVSQFKIYKKYEEYREVLKKVEYSGYGSRFEIYWKTPYFLTEKPSRFIVIELEGVNGDKPERHWSVVEADGSFRENIHKDKTKIQD